MLGAGASDWPPRRPAGGTRKKLDQLALAQLGTLLGAPGRVVAPWNPEQNGGRHGFDEWVLPHTDVAPPVPHAYRRRAGRNNRRGNGLGSSLGRSPPPGGTVRISHLHAVASDDRHGGLEGSAASVHLTRCVTGHDPAPVRACLAGPRLLRNPRRLLLKDIERRRYGRPRSNESTVGRAERIGVANDDLLAQGNRTRRREAAGRDDTPPMLSASARCPCLAFQPFDAPITTKMRRGGRPMSRSHRTNIEHSPPCLGPEPLRDRGIERGLTTPGQARSGPRPRPEDQSVLIGPGSVAVLGTGLSRARALASPKLGEQ